MNDEGMPVSSTEKTRLGGGRSRLALLTVALATVTFGVMFPQGTAKAGVTSAPVLSGSIANSTSLSGVRRRDLRQLRLRHAYYAGTLTAVDISKPSTPRPSSARARTRIQPNGVAREHLGGYAYVASKNRNAPAGRAPTTTAPATPHDPRHRDESGAVRRSWDRYATRNLFGAYGVACLGQLRLRGGARLSVRPAVSESERGRLVRGRRHLDPANPTIVSTLNNSNLPSPWTGTGALKHACSVFVLGNYAYVTAAYSNRLTVIDISTRRAHRSSPRSRTGARCPGRRRGRRRLRVRRRPDRQRPTVVDVQKPT